MSYGYFDTSGKEYVITTPRTPARWYNYLFNDDYYLEVSQTAQGTSSCLKPSRREHTRGYRYFYVYDQETKDCWNPNYVPLKQPLDEFRCIHSLGWSRYEAARNGVETELLVYVPRHGSREVWRYKVTNRSAHSKSLSLYSVFGLESYGVEGAYCRYDKETHIVTSHVVPPHAKYEDAYEINEKNSIVYLYSDRNPDGVECRQSFFFGADDLTDMPQVIADGGCRNRISSGRDPVGAMEHRITLGPGEQTEISLVLGCANSMEEIKASSESLLTPGFTERELAEVEAYWQEVCGQLHIQTPDGDLDALVNYWLKKQTVLMSRNHRLSVYAPIRNELQDAIGYAMLDPECAASIMLKVAERQQADGFIRQWYMRDNSPPRGLCLLTHRDGPMWLILCYCALIQQTGDRGLLEQQAGFIDSEEKATVYEHLLRAVWFAAGDTGAHGLSLMGDGDWTDPINGPGRLGKGESAWSTLALIYCASELAKLAELKEDHVNAERLLALADRFRRSVNEACWDGKWYAAGFDDQGDAFGTEMDEEGKVFLNTQTWAIISETANGDRLEKCLRAIDSLDTPAGPLLLYPPFTRWNPKWGRISLKVPGGTENGAIYCHGSLFKAFADCLAGRGTKAYETIIRTLPTNPDNPPEKNLQVPLFVPNYYRGVKQDPDFGQSSQFHSTGTSAWILWVAVEYLLGARATAHGLVMDPCLPLEWEGARLTRRYKEAMYDITIRKGKGIEKGHLSIAVDGVLLEGTTLPYCAGAAYQVEVTMK